MTRTRREFGAMMAGACAAATLSSGLFARTAAAQPAADVPWGGPLAPDKPLAKAYVDAAKALAGVDDNPVIQWQYRVWCETGYRTLREAGTGQPIDKPADPAADFVSPKGFLYTDYAQPMPTGGVRFLDNAWYFGTDLTGLVLVRTPDGLVMFDALTTPQDMRTQFLDQAAAAGLDPRDITYIFLGHQHVDHVGGANLIRDNYAPQAKFVMGQPDAAVIAERLADLRRHRDEYTKEEYRARLAQVPSRIDIEIEPFPGHTVGMKHIRIGPTTTAVAMLTPGHTDGQMTVIVPVVHNGQSHRLVVWSGNDNIHNATQYAISTEFVQGVAVQEGADAFMNTHA
ncbi:MBL fold metallo-hydrolase, partial [Streptomyces sp. MCAF7]